jgi:glycosyltransferase involved in cell wall biosynthesis
MVDVSIIIPTYNRLWCLPRAIESCRNTKCKVEIIVVDDGSSDGTLSWLNSQKDLVIVSQRNLGQTFAINKGFRVSQGNFIRFLDSDDFLENGIIDKQFDLAIRTSADLVYSRVSSLDEKNVISPLTFTFCPDFIEAQLGFNSGSHFLGMMFKRWLIELTPRRPDFALREDRMFLLEVALLLPKVEFLDINAGFWFQHPSQMQRNYFGLLSCVANWQHLNIYKIIISRLSQNNQLTTSRINAAVSILWQLSNWISKYNIHEGHLVYRYILTINPKFKFPESFYLRILFKYLGFSVTQKILKLRRFFFSLLR